LKQFFGKGRPRETSVPRRRPPKKARLYKRLKGVPAFTPALLWCIAIIPLYGGDFSLSASGGSLLVTPDGMSGYTLGGLSYEGEPGLYLTMGAGKVFLNLSQVRGDITVAAGRFGLQTKNIGTAFSAGVFSHSAFNADFGKMVFNSEGGTGSLFDTALSFRIHEFTLEPSVSYAAASWDRGDFYWFLGKPKLPAFWRWGLKGAYGVHSLGFNFFFLDADILNNDEVPLFEGVSRGTALYYRFSSKNRNFPLRAALGYFYAAAGMEGELTSSNQGYSVFPYRFYNLDGSISAHAGFAMISLEYGFSIFRVNAALGAVQVFQGTASADIHYQKKRLFGGEEKTEPLSKDLGSPGAAFLSVGFGMPSLRIGAKTKLSLGIKKTLALPWGYGKIFSAGESADPDSSSGGGFGTDLFRTILLSGLSLHGSLAIR
jgi:hypothetical protein